jgi:NADH-quinone oxidoreductase subunit E
MYPGVSAARLEKVNATCSVNNKDASRMLIWQASSKIGRVAMSQYASLQQEIEHLVGIHGSGHEALMPILQDINKSHGHVSGEAMVHISKALKVPRSEIYGVVTFYSFLSARPRGRYVIRVCRTISCEMQGNRHPVMTALSQELGIGLGETTADKLFTLEETNCIGMCDQGPAMLVNEDVHVRLTPEAVREILAEYRRLGVSNGAAKCA